MWKLDSGDVIPLRSNVVSVGEGSEAWPSLSGEAYASSMAGNKNKLLLQQNSVQRG